LADILGIPDGHSFEIGSYWPRIDRNPKENWRWLQAGTFNSNSVFFRKQLANLLRVSCSL
jgi:hypothetical protein